MVVSVLLVAVNIFTIAALCLVLLALLIRAAVLQAS